MHTKTKSSRPAATEATQAIKFRSHYTNGNRGLSTRYRMKEFGLLYFLRIMGAAALIYGYVVLWGLIGWRG